MKRMMLLLTLTLAAPVLADYDLSWWTVDGGGAMWSTGGDYELSGTIGQADAGVVMSGGDYQVIGGFWLAAVPACLGDCNCDGVIDFDDINALVAVLSDPGSACFFPNLDINADGAVDFDDINGFVAILSGSSGPCP
jgi:hypothetical protein